MQIEVNGESREVPEGISLAELVHDLALAPERLAIEYNREVVPRATWNATVLRSGDRIEIVHFVGGGSKVFINCVEDATASGKKAKLALKHRLSTFVEKS